MKLGMYYFHVYMVRCIDGTFYVGHTDNLEQRIVEHNNGVFGGYTATRKPVELVWSTDFSTRDDAFAVERQIKNWSRDKKKKFRYKSRYARSTRGER